jgi:hypothetical protein
MTILIPTNGGKNTVNGLDIKNTLVVIFDMATLKILNTCQNYTKADEISCDYYRKNIDARTTDLDFFSDTINAKNIIGKKLSEFQHFVDNNTHPLISA